MSGDTPDAPPGPPPGTQQCPRCGAEVAPDQDWCLDCGYAVRTRVAPTPRWRIPVAIAGTVAVLALAALAVAFVDLTEDPETVTAPATTPTTQTVPPPATVPPATTTTPPVTTTPPATTTPPPTTTPNPTATAPAAPEPPDDTGGTAAP